MPIRGKKMFFQATQSTTTALNMARGFMFILVWVILSGITTFTKILQRIKEELSIRMQVRIQSSKIRCTTIRQPTTGVLSILIWVRNTRKDNVLHA